VMPTRNRQPKTTTSPIRKLARSNMLRQSPAQALMPCPRDPSYTPI
jgi:hypothetical protein